MPARERRPGRRTPPPVPNEHESASGAAPDLINEEAERVRRVLTDPGLPEGARNILSELLLDLSNETKVFVSDPKVVREFYTLACRLAHQTEGDAFTCVSEIRRILDRVERGEAFEGYADHEGLEGYDRRRRGEAFDAVEWRRAQLNAGNKRLVEKIERIGREVAASVKDVFDAALVRWAEVTELRKHFPRVDPAGPGAIVYIDYCARMLIKSEGSKYHGRAWGAHWWRGAVVDFARFTLENHHAPEKVEKKYQSLQRSFERWQKEQREIEARWRAEESRREAETQGERQHDSLTDLRRQLQRLREEGDITNQTAIFELERRIYDLEREADPDEWPEFIDE